MTRAEMSKVEKVAVDVLVERGWRFIDYEAPGSFTLDPDLPTLLSQLMAQEPQGSYCWRELLQIQHGERNPFWTMEAIGEHIGAAWGALGREGRDLSRRHPAHNRFPVGSVEYHLMAIERAHKRLFQMLACLLPQLYHLDESSVWEALERRRAELQKEQEEQDA